MSAQMTPLSNLVGPRRPLGIGITNDEYRRDHLPTPPDRELSKWSANPRNAIGDWYEDAIQSRLEQFCPNYGWTWKTQVNLGYSEVHLGDRIVDVLVNNSLGLECKFLKGEGSLVRPKILADVLDFTNREVHCIYVIDGPGWLSEVEYLGHLWDFTCANDLEQTIAAFTSNVRLTNQPLKTVQATVDSFSQNA